MDKYKPIHLSLLSRISSQETEESPPRLLSQMTPRRENENLWKSQTSHGTLLKGRVNLLPSVITGPQWTGEIGRSYWWRKGESIQLVPYQNQLQFCYPKNKKNPTWGWETAIAMAFFHPLHVFSCTSVLQSHSNLLPSIPLWYPSSYSFSSFISKFFSMACCPAWYPSKNAWFYNISVHSLSNVVPAVLISFLMVSVSASSISSWKVLYVVFVLICGIVGTMTLTEVAGVSVELSGIHLASNTTRNLSQ